MVAYYVFVLCVCVPSNCTHPLVCRRESNWLCCCAAVWLFVAETAGAFFAVGRPSEDDAVPVKRIRFFLQGTDGEHRDCRLSG
jgi:hypothetical protein